MKFIKKTIFTLNIGLVILLLLSYVAPFANPNTYPYFQILGASYPVLLLANLSMILLWLFIDYKKMFLSLFAVIIGFTHLTGFINVSGKGVDKSSHIKVMSYNLGQSYHVRSAKNKEKVKQDFKDFLNAHSDVDVFCLQECDYFARKTLKSIFPEMHIHEIENRATYIMSSFPILQSGEIPFGTKTNSCLWADLKTPKGPIRIYSMHLQSNKVSKDADKVIQDANLQEKKTWVGIKGILSKYSHFGKKRAVQASLIQNHASQSTYPALICGDLNDPPTTFTYATLCGDYQDSFSEVGSGIGTTYAGKIPMLRIDYIFADRKLNVKSFKVLKEPFSDHYPILGTYTLK